MIVNEQNTAIVSDKSGKQLYADFAELLYNIYIESQIDFHDENIDTTNPQKLEYDI